MLICVGLGPTADIKQQGAHSGAPIDPIYQQTKKKKALTQENKVEFPKTI